MKDIEKIPRTAGIWFKKQHQEAMENRLFDPDPEKALIYQALLASHDAIQPFYRNYEFLSVKTFRENHNYYYPQGSVGLLPISDELYREVLELEIYLIPDLHTYLDDLTQSGRLSTLDEQTKNKISSLSQALNSWYKK